MSSLVLGSRKIFTAVTNQSHDKGWVYLETCFDKNKCKSINKLEALVIAGSPVLSKSYGINLSFYDFLDRINYLLNKYKPKNVILISSASVYGFSIDPKNKFSENSELLGTSEYAIEKILLEKQIMNYLEIFHQTKFLILRPAGFFNCFSKRSKNSFIDRILKFDYLNSKSFFEIKHDGRQIRDFCDFETLIHMILNFTWHKNDVLSVMNLSTTKAFTIREIILNYIPRDMIRFQKDAKKNIHSQLSNEHMFNQTKSAFLDGSLKLVNDKNNF